jgi:hypothetical protein
MVIGKRAKYRRTGSELNGKESEVPAQDYLHVEEKQYLCRHIIDPEGSGRLRPPDFETVGT